MGRSIIYLYIYLKAEDLTKLHGERVDSLDEPHILRAFEKDMIMFMHAFLEDFHNIIKPAKNIAF